MERKHPGKLGACNPVFSDRQRSKRYCIVFSAAQITLAVAAAGMLIMLIRLLIQFISFRRLMKEAVYISGSAMKLYQVNEDIVPFSFGNAVFINKNLHTESDLQEIIRHEFVHIKQKHSADILWGELLCLINWFNPFAWLLKKAIRQNLEFIADNHVIQNGMNKKEYQYLLLKVTGNNQYSIATPFNFSSLKKRIAMMNKLKSAKVNLLRFLFILPLLAVILVSFRKQIGDGLRQHKPEKAEANTINHTDTIPNAANTNSKGYYISIIDNKGNCMVVVKDRNQKEVKRLLLTEWDKKPGSYEEIYGEIPPPPPPQPDALNMTDNIRCDLSDIEKIEVWTKEGKKEIFNLTIPSQKEEFEKKYRQLALAPLAPAMPPMPSMPATPPMPPALNGRIMEVPLAPAMPSSADDIPVPQAPAAPAEPLKLPQHVTSININNEKAVVKLKNGTVEEYNFSDAGQKEVFEKKYGNLQSFPNPPKAPVRIVIQERPAASQKIVEEKLPENLLYFINDKKATKAEVNAIAPKQIETVNVLKGDAAIALYGSAAKDGAVKIKTKRQANILEEKIIPVTGKPKHDNTGSLMEERVLVKESLGTLKALADPLIILDGKEVNSSMKSILDEISPNDIESIDILKDKNATDRYGEKGKNGVLIIKTKKGTARPVTFLQSSNAGQDGC
jgi:TonB-dependent SusC/RagA subfamily outer membrane receptor